MYWIASDGSGHPQAIAGAVSGDIPCSVAPDGDTLAFMRQNAQTSRDVYVLSLGGQSRPRPVVNTPHVSSDGQRFVMIKDEAGSGRLNVVLNWQEELKQRVPTR